MNKQVNTESLLHIGVSSFSGRPVLTDRNPHLEGLSDIHRCIFMPNGNGKKPRNSKLDQAVNINLRFI
jgi:hypothetical protein